MNTRILKIFTVVSAMFFLSSCVVFVGDGDHHHHGYWRRHSSLQQSDQSAVQLTAQNSGDVQSHNQVRR